MTESETLRRRIRELERELEETRSSLAEEQAANQALQAGQVDAIVDRSGGGALLLQAAQAALRASEERYRTIVTTADEGIWMADAQQVTTFANERVASMLGYTVEEMIGRPAEDFLDPSAREEARQGFERRRQGVRERRDMALRRKDGTILWASVNASPLVGTDGTFAGVLVMGTDITERRRLEEARRSTEERFARVFQASPIPIAIATSKGDILDVNARYAEFFGYSNAELVGHNVEDLGLWAKAADRQRLIDVMSGQGVVEQYERRLRRKDGKECWCLVSGAPILDSDGRFAGAFGMFTDVTERRRATELLRESEERYRHIVETATEGIWSLDAKLRTTFVNGAFERMLGYTSGEMLGSPAERYTFPEDLDELRGRMDTRRRGVAAQYECRFRRKDGKECWCLVSGTPILDSDGRFAGSFGMLTDITDRRRLEEQLRQSQKMEAVGRLAGGVAHDFNNLLTVILGYSDVLLRGLEPGPLLEATQEIRQAGERAAALTRQLLAFSRKQTLVPEVLDLGDVVSGLSTMVERLIGEDVKVSVVVSPGLGRVKADRGQLEQVVVNLAVNARDAMPKGGSLIFELQNVELDAAYAATHAEVKPGPYVLMAISDTGTGIDAETQKRVFEPFFTTKETGKGTGLGLSTVHGIVLQSGGTIDVYSEPGQGATFKVYLPRFAGEAIPRPASGGHPAPAAESETVLVVEDEAAIRQLARLILQKAGYTVLLAESPVAAERIAGSHPGPIHLMLTDVVMPDMRGPELAQRLLRLRPDLRVLYMSGYTDDAIAHHGLLDAGTEFLQKPFTPLHLTEKVRDVLGRPGRSLPLP